MLLSSRNRGRLMSHLESKGKWDEFERYRGGRVLELGERGALDAAIRRFFPGDSFDRLFEEWCLEDEAALGRTQSEAFIAIEGSGTSVQSSAGEKVADSQSLAAVSAFENVRWVADCIGDPSVKREDAPSRAAWNLLQWAQSSSQATKDFWTTHFKGIMPSKSQLDAEGERGTDRVDELIVETIRGLGLDAKREGRVA